MKFKATIAAVAGLLTIVSIGTAKADSYTFTPLTATASLFYPTPSSFVFVDPNTFVFDQTYGFPLGDYYLSFDGTYSNPVTTPINTTTYSLSGLGVAIDSIPIELNGTGSLSVQPTSTGYGFDFLSSDVGGDVFTFSGQLTPAGQFLAGDGTYTPAPAPEAGSLFGFGALLLGGGVVYLSKRKQSPSAS